MGVSEVSISSRTRAAQRKEPEALALRSVSSWKRSDTVNPRFLARCLILVVTRKAMSLLTFFASSSVSKRIEGMVEKDFDMLGIFRDVIIVLREERLSRLASATA